MSVVTLRKIKQSFDVSEEKITAQIVTKNLWMMLDPEDRKE